MAIRKREWFLQWVFWMIVASLCLSTASCSKDRTSQVIPPPSGEDIPLVTPSVIDLETEKPVKATSTTTITVSPIMPTVSPTPTSRAEHCPAVHPSLPGDFLTSGTILFDQLEKTAPGNDPVMIFKRGMTQPQDFLFNIPCCTSFKIFPESDVSPDRQWLVTWNQSPVDDTEQYLVFINGNPDDTQRIPLSAKWSANLYWVNSNQLLIASRDHRYYVDQWFLVNPFQNTSQPFVSDMPYLIAEWDAGDWLQMYDSSLSRVVYLRFHEVALAVESVVLWDVDHAKILWQRHLSEKEHAMGTRQPRWSQDGQRFAILVLQEGASAWYELLIIDRDGKEFKVVDPLLPDPIMAGSGLNWSPDGRYLSFFIVDHSMERLLIYDLQTGAIWDPCITGDPGDRPYLRLPVIWSPDSRQFLVDMMEKDNEKQVDYWVVDVEKKEIAPLGFGFFSAAWLVGP